MNNKRNGVVAGVLLAVAAQFSFAGIIVDINESGSDVTAIFGGSIDLNTVSSLGASGLTGGLVANLSLISFAPAFTVVGGDRYALNILSSDGNWGFGVSFPDSNSGDALNLSINTNSIVLPTSYSSGSNISGSMTFLSKTLSSMGLIVGSYTYTFGQVGAAQDFVTVNVGQGQVPVPATLALLGVGFAGFGWSRRKKA